MKKRKGILIIAILVSIFSSCIEKVEHKPKRSFLFNKQMTDLVKKYPKFPDADSNDYSKKYKLVKRVTIPENYHNSEITYELRSNYKDDSWSFEVIYAYNDSNEFLIPLSDLYYYWRTSQENSEIDSAHLQKKLTFEVELNNFIDLFKFKHPPSAICPIMTLILSYDFITRYNICALEQLGNDEILKPLYNEYNGETFYRYNDRCRAKYIYNIEEIKNKLDNPMAFSYYKDALIFTLTFSKNNVEVDVLNYECSNILLW